VKLTVTQGVALRALNDAKEVADGGWKDHTLRKHGYRVIHRRTLDALVARGLVEESPGYLGWARLTDAGKAALGAHAR